MTDEQNEVTSQQIPQEQGSEMQASTGDPSSALQEQGPTTPENDRGPGLHVEIEDMKKLYENTRDVILHGEGRLIMRSNYARFDTEDGKEDPLFRGVHTAHFVTPIENNDPESGGRYSHDAFLSCRGDRSQSSDGGFFSYGEVGDIAERMKEAGINADAQFDVHKNGQSRIVVTDEEGHSVEIAFGFNSRGEKRKYIEDRFPNQEKPNKELYDESIMICTIGPERVANADRSPFVEFTNEEEFTAQTEHFARTIEALTRAMYRNEKVTPVTNPVLTIPKDFPPPYKAY